MNLALWVSKSGLDAQQKNIDVISNNLANANTTGYKSGRAVFNDLLYQTIRQPGAQETQDAQLPSGLMVGTGVKIAATQKSFTQGSVLQTNNPLDLSISGQGFFQVLNADGNINYTRDGGFQINSDGNLVTANGNAVEPAITIPADANSITIGADGTVSVLQPGSTTPTTVGTLQLADFVNPAGLQPIGNNLFIETAASGSPTTGNPGATGLGTLSQGSLEGSNVSIVEELVNLIETQRTYEMNAKAIETVDGMLQFVSQTL